MTDAKGTALSLHRITQLPLDFSNPIYSQYPLMKLGVYESVLYYAKQLVPLAKQLMAANPEYEDWVLTSPPYFVISSGANRLCWRVEKLLKNTLPESFSVSAIDTRQKKRDWASQDHESLKKGHDYSKLTWEDRKKARAIESNFIIPDDSFRDRPVIFVNDINVTGAQRGIMEDYFQRMGAAIVNWLYVIDVDESIGKSEPKLENYINYSTHASLDEFARIIACENIQYTGKCIWRIFGYSLEEMELLVRRLDASRRAKILDMVVKEGRFDSTLFKEKMELLKSSCTALERV